MSQPETRDSLLRLCERDGCEEPIPAGKKSTTRYCSDHCRKRACDDRNRGTCACGAPLGRGGKWRGYEKCAPCYRAEITAAHDAKLDDVAHMFNAGLSMREIADELGYGPNSTPGAVTEARQRGLVGVRHAFDGTEVREVRDSLIAGMWEDGWLAAEIADVVGLSTKSIYQAALDLGLPYRHAGYSERYGVAA